MIKTFKYTKADGSVSTRKVYQLNIVGGDKLLCADLTEFNEDEVQDYSDILDGIHAEYIQAIKDVGLGSTFRTFLLDRMG